MKTENSMNKGKGENPIHVGIDFGACNIKAVMWDGKRFTAPKLNSRENPSRSCPNFLFYKTLESGDLEHVLGLEAKRRAITEPDNVVHGIKRKLEREEWHEFIPALQREISAIDAAKDVFDQIKIKLGRNDEEPIPASLSVPVSFTDIQIGRLRKAAEEAGFDVRNIVSESFAAMFSLRELDELEEGLHLVFDFGGSTLDVSVFRVSHEQGLEICELGASGLRLGGMDIDNAIMDHLVSRGDYPYLAKAFENKKLAPETVRQNLLMELEEKKEDLFNGFEDEISLSIEPVINLARDDFRVILDTEMFRGRIITLLDNLFEELENGPISYNASDVVRIWPFGGSVRINWVKELLEEYFSAAVFSADDFDPEDSEPYIEIKGLDDSFNYMGIAAGAARLPSLMEEENITIKSALPFHVGFLRDKKFIPCLEKNSPAGFESPYRLLPLPWLAANDWEVSIYQKFSTGDYDEPIYMGKIVLTPDLYPGDEFPILTMRINPDGNLRILISQRQLCGEEQEYDINLVQEFILNKGSAYESE